MRPLQLILGPTFDDTAEKFEARLRPVDMMEASLVAQIVRAHWRLQLCEKLENPTSPDTERVRHHAEGSIRRNTAELRQLQADRHLNDRLNMDVPGVARVREVLQSELLARKLEGTPAPQPQPSVVDVESRIETIMTKEQELNETNLKIPTHSEGGSVSLSDSASHRRPSLSPHEARAGEPLGQAARAGKNSGQRTHLGHAPGATKTSGPIGRNTPCPCGSKTKYKRCCGLGASPQSLLVNAPPPNEP